MQLKFGKFKGKTIGEVAESIKGREYLGWFLENVDVNDAKNDGKYAAKNKGLADEIRKVIGSSPAPTKVNVPNTSNSVVLAKLDSIEQKLDKLISKSSGLEPDDDITFGE